MTYPNSYQVVLIHSAQVAATPLLVLVGKLSSRSGCYVRDTRLNLEGCEFEI